MLNRPSSSEIGIPNWCKTHKEINRSADGPYWDCVVELLTCCCPAGSYDMGSPHEPYCRMVGQ